MAISQNRPRPRENHLLARLPAAERERLWPLLQPVRLGSKQVLERPGEPIEQVYFPLNGVCSSVSVMEDGATVEVATVGRDGLLGLSLFFGSETTPFQVFSQIPGDALRMSAEAFCEAVEAPGPLQDLVRRYAEARFTQTAQSAACNRLHPVEQRCARWLLMTHDRVGGAEFILTHEFLAAMLGVRRASVSAVAAVLQRAGLIRYQRGRMTIVNRQGLEAAACECYQIITTEYDRLLGPPSAGDPSLPSRA